MKHGYFLLARLLPLMLCACPASASESIPNAEDVFPADAVFMINFGNVSEGVSEYLASPEGVQIVSEQMEALKTGGGVFRKYVDAG